MMTMSFESNVAFHCAPTLAGIKPSNLFTWHHVKEGNIETYIDDLRRKFIGSDLTVDMLCQCEHYSLILIYRKNMLEGSIGRTEIRDFLSGFGYAKDGNLCLWLEKLKSRIKLGDGFPHEIGVFLGYPLHDVVGFIDSPERRCALCGEWKVYENEFEASIQFERIKKCRTVLYRRYMSGSDIADLVA